MFERFSDEAIVLILQAQEESRRLGHDYTGPEMLLLALIRDGATIPSRALKFSGLNVDCVRASIKEIAGPGVDTTQILRFTPEFKRLMEYSLSEAEALGACDVEPEHLLLGLICQIESDVLPTVVSKVFEAYGLKCSVLRSSTLKLCES